LTRFLLICQVVTLGVCTRLDAVPPFVTGDVPTAEKQSFELYLGTRYESARGTINRQLGFTEIVYGISDRQEITFETSYLSQDGGHGIGDSIFGTKYMFVKETKTLPGIASTFELKVPTASASRDLGTGEFDFDLRLNVQKTWGAFTTYGNIGYIIVGEPGSGSTMQPRNHLWFFSVAQEFEIVKNTSLLGEVYWQTGEERGAPARLAGNVGFEHKFNDKFRIHAMVGKSLQEANHGGPSLRVYVGLQWDFDAPWRHAAN